MVSTHYWIGTNSDRPNLYGSLEFDNNIDGSFESFYRDRLNLCIRLIIAIDSGDEYSESKISRINPED